MLFVTIDLYYLLAIDFTLFCNFAIYFAVFTTWLHKDGRTDQWTDRPTDGRTNGWTMSLSDKDALDASEKDDFPTNRQSIDG